MSSSILIADGHRGRARQLGEACAAIGLNAAFAENGAFALESALADLPDLLLTTGELALIDSFRLAQILRANPRTQEVRIVHLGREDNATRAAGLYDEVLPPTAPAEEVAARIESLLAQRARIDAVDRETSADHEVQGSLSQIPLADLLQLFHMNRRTGTMELSRNEPGGRGERGLILLRDGNAIQARCGATVEGEKALFRLLSWRDGSFAFSPNRVSAAPRILTPTRALLIEGMRQLDEWDRMRNNLPPLAAHVALAVAKEDLPNAVHPVTQEVLLLLEIYDRVGDVVDHCSHPDYQVLRTLRTLIDRGLVRVRREPDAGIRATGSLFEADQMRRLRDWLEAGRPRGAALPDAKLLLASPDAAATEDVFRLLAGLPGMELDPRAQRRGLDGDDVVEIGRLSVGDGLGIRLLHLPISQAMAPTWPVLAHGALGTLLLLAAPIDANEMRLQPLIRALGRLPDARTFHVLLLRKGERVDPGELHDKLSLLDSSSLFLLQLESDKDPVALLRTMLARVIP